MNSLRKYLHKIGLDGWIFALTGLGAIAFGVLSALGLWPFSQNLSLQIIASAIGVLMLAVVVQTAKRQAEIEELKNALGVTQTRLINRGDEFVEHLTSNARNANHFIYDTHMTDVSPNLSSKTDRFVYNGKPSSNYGFSGPYANYFKLLYTRVTKREIYFRYVTMIFNLYTLEEVIFKLLLHEGYRYRIRHYEPPPKAIPIVNLMSFDDKEFYYGGFEIRETARPAQVLFTSDPNTAELFKDYYDTLWNEAISLNEGGVIDWVELKRIGLRLGMADDDFESMVKEVEKEVKRQKSQMNH
jgi:hypothetical protein